MVSCVAACVLAVSGCISSDLDVVEAGPDDHGPAAGERTSVGEDVTTAQGNAVTVHAVEGPTDVAGSDLRLIDAEVEICAASEGGGTTPSATYFRALVPGEGYRRPSPPARRPPLPSHRLDAGECARGWVGFPLRSDEDVEAIVLLASSTVEWALTGSG